MNHGKQLQQTSQTKHKTTKIILDEDTHNDLVQLELDAIFNEIDENVPVGDDPQIKSEHAIRVMGHNMYGKRNTNGYVTWKALIQHIRSKIQADIICLQETNTKWDGSLRIKVQQILASYEHK